MKIATWNVNSIRARILNFIDWIKEANPDVVLLQELKCTDAEFPYSEIDNLGYNIEVFGEKGRNGVAILSKFRLYDVVKGLSLYDIVDSDNESRYLEVCIDYKGFVIKLISVYVPNGGPSAIEVRNGIDDITKTGSFAKKMKFEDRLKKKLEESVKNNEIAFFCGDYNVCPNLYIDVYSPKKDGSITCTEQERQKFRELLSSGVADIWRNLNPELQEYTWWGYRPYTMFQKNQGYRLDAILTTPKASELVKECKIYRDVRGKEKASDHVPMMCEID